MQLLKNKVEAILFSTGKKIALDHIAKLCKASREEALEALAALKKEYAEKDSSLAVMDEGEFWKFMVREHFSPIVRKIVPHTELTKTMIETLAAIAWKAPVLQSDIIKIRTNKAYDHMGELEKAGFISREKHGRTQLIKLTQRFYDYFDVHNEQEVKDKFRKFNEKIKPSQQQTQETVQDSAPGETENKNEQPNNPQVPALPKQDEVQGN
ncbi:SMC-Scp complex subunit ScpB [Candidatus Woesearchaeota archaeon]|nr:SMC-Scp complex subunit ScpB [Candidatus Woesearchaeota archaeon]